jgi:hypothetical protein
MYGTMNIKFIDNLINAVKLAMLQERFWKARPMERNRFGGNNQRHSESTARPGSGDSSVGKGTGYGPDGPGIEFLCRWWWWGW